jgi:hypothetical protein
MRSILAGFALLWPSAPAVDEAEDGSWQWYTECAMRANIEDYFLNPPPGSAAARAVEFGIDLTLTIEHLRLTPEQRIRKLDDFIEGVAKLKAIQEAQAITTHRSRTRNKFLQVPTSYLIFRA